MRRQIAALVAWTSTAIVVSFVIPLCLLVQTLASDRAMASADQEARSVAIIVSTLADDPRLGDLVQDAGERAPGTTSVLLPGGVQIGEPATGLAADPEVRRAQLGEAFSITDAAGGRVLVPVSTERGLAVVRTSVTPDQLRGGVPLAWALIIAMGVLLTAVTHLAARQAGRRISEPLRAVAATAHELRGGNLAARASVRGPEETTELASALNGLADRIGELLAAERAAVGDLAHRLRTPVTALRLESERVADPAAAEALLGHLDELQRSIDALVTEARRPLREDLTTGCDAVATVQARVGFWSALAEDQGRNLVVDVPTGPLQVRLGEHDLCDVVDILIDNVFAHTPDSVGLSVALVRETDAAGRESAGRESAGRESAILTVSDTGPGFPVRPLDGHRTGSTGLGLDIVRRTAASVGGSVETSEPGSPGARVTVRIPLAG